MASGAGGRPAARRACARPGGRCAPPCPTARRPCSGGAARRPRPRGRTGPPPAANFMSSTAPMPKFGAMTHAELRLRRQPLARRSRAWPRRSRVVPTTQWMSWSMQNRMLSMTDVGPGEVDDHLGAGVGDVEQPVAARRPWPPARGRRPRSTALHHLGPHAAAGAEHADGRERGLAAAGVAELLVGAWRSPGQTPEAAGCKRPAINRGGGARRPGARRAGRAGRRRRRPASRPPRRPAARASAPCSDLADRGVAAPARASGTARPTPAHRPVRPARRTGRRARACPRPAGAAGTSPGGANSTASDTSTATTNAPRASGAVTGEPAARSQPVEVRLAVGPDHGQAAVAG